MAMTMQGRRKSESLRLLIRCTTTLQAEILRLAVAFEVGALRTNHVDRSNVSIYQIVAPRLMSRRASIFFSLRMHLSFAVFHSLSKF